MITPLPFVSIDGKIFAKENAHIPALNNGVLFGEGVFTTMKVKNGIPLFFEKHEKRLFSHMKQLGIPALSPSFSLEEAVNSLIKKNKRSECAVRVTVINGEHPLVIIHSRELPQSSKTGIGLITVQDTRDEFKTAKTISRIFLNHVHKQAEQKGAADALLISGGMMIESTICNIISQSEKGKLITPPLDGKGLKGIGRAVIMERTEVLEQEIPEKSKGPFVLINSLRAQKVDAINEKNVSDAEELFQKIKSIIEQAEEEYLYNR